MLRSSFKNNNTKLDLENQHEVLLLNEKYDIKTNSLLKCMRNVIQQQYKFKEKHQRSEYKQREPFVSNRERHSYIEKYLLFGVKCV